MTIEQDDSFLATLTAPMTRQLCALAQVTCGEQTLDDLKSEAWLIAYDIQEEQGYARAPEDPVFQREVLFELWKKFGRFANREMRFAVRLDQDTLTGDGEWLDNSVAAGLAAPDSDEPEVAMLNAERQATFEQTLASRFTEAVGYLGVLEYFRSDLSAIAMHLAISVATVKKRFARAGIVAEQQTSLFDGLEPIADSFAPPRSRLKRRRRRSRPWARVCLSRRPRQQHLFSVAPEIFSVW